MCHRCFLEIFWFVPLSYSRLPSSIVPRPAESSGRGRGLAQSLNVALANKWSISDMLLEPLLFCSEPQLSLPDRGVPDAVEMQLRIWPFTVS